MIEQLPLHMICSPIGGAGNHIRWLMLLDSRYQFTLEGVSLSSADSKLLFIDQYIYPNSRTWDNWLAFEWRYRDQINCYLKFSHSYTDFYDGLKTIGVRTDPLIAFKHYYKFNPGLNSHTKETFSKQINRENWIAELLDKEFEHFMLVDGSKIFAPLLDQSIYYQMINFLELEDHYETAQKIHAKWFNLNKKAETAIIKDLKKIYQS